MYPIVSLGSRAGICAEKVASSRDLHRSSRAHGFRPSVVHFPRESAYLGRKLSDRILKDSCRERGSATRGERSSFPAERGERRIVATLQGSWQTCELSLPSCGPPFSGVHIGPVGRTDFCPF